MRHFIGIALLILASPHLLLCQQLERGQASVSSQHRTIQTESDLFEEVQNETDLIFNLWQESINYGRLEANFIFSGFDGK